MIYQFYCFFQRQEAFGLTDFAIFFPILYSIDFILTFVFSFIFIFGFNLLFLSQLHQLEFDVNASRPLFFFNIGRYCSKYCFVSISESLIGYIFIFFISKHFLISLLLFSLTYMLFCSVLIIYHVFGYFPQLFVPESQFNYSSRNVV